MSRPRLLNELIASNHRRIHVRIIKLLITLNHDLNINFDVFHIEICKLSQHLSYLRTNHLRSSNWAAGFSLPHRPISALQLLVNVQGRTAVCTSAQRLAERSYSPIDFNSTSYNL